MKRLLVVLCLLLAGPSYANTFALPGNLAATTNGNQLIAACRDAVDGDLITLAAGTYRLNTAALIQNKSVSIVGEGKLSIVQVMTTGDSAGAAMSAIVITQNNACANMRLENFVVSTNTGGVTNKTLYAIYDSSLAGGSIDTFRMARITTSGFITGIEIQDNTAGGIGEHVLLDNVNAIGAGRWGIDLEGCAQAAMRQCAANSCGIQGIRVLSCGAGFVMEGCVAQGCNTTNQTSLEGAAQCLIKLSHGFTVLGYFSENLSTGATSAKCGLTISNCFGGHIACANVSDPAAQLDSYGIRLISGSHGIDIGSVVYTTVAFPISVDATSTYPTILPRNIIKF